MGAQGSSADFVSIAAYLDTAKPTITLEPVAHDSPGTQIDLGDIIESKAIDNAFLKIITSIVTVNPPTKGTVTYKTGNGNWNTFVCHLHAFPRAIRRRHVDLSGHWELWL